MTDAPDIAAVIARVRARLCEITDPENEGWFVRIAEADRDALLSHIDAQAARIAALEAGLKPFKEIADHDIGSDEDDSDNFRPIHHKFRCGPRLTVGHFRRARALLKEPTK